MYIYIYNRRAHAHAHAHAHAQANTHARARTHARTHTRTHTHAHARAHARTRTRTCTHTHTHTHAHTHTHTTASKDECDQNSQCTSRVERSVSIPRMLASVSKTSKMRLDEYPSELTMESKMDWSACSPRWWRTAAQRVSGAKKQKKNFGGPAALQRNEPQSLRWLRKTAPRD